MRKAFAVALVFIVAGFMSGCAVTQGQYSKDHQDSKIIQVMDSAGLSPEVFANMCARVASNEIELGTFSKAQAIEKLNEYRGLIRIGASYKNLIDVSGYYADLYAKNDPVVSMVSIIVEVLVVTQLQSMPGAELPMIQADIDVLTDLIDTILSEIEKP